MEDPIQAKRIEKQVVEIVMTHPFFASLLLRMRVIEDPQQPTFCTNGAVLKYNPKFAATLSDAELRGVLAHEVMHPALGHIWRLGSRDHGTANIAADHAVNLFLNEYNDSFASGGTAPPFPLPAGAYADKRFTGKSFEEIYSIIFAEKPPQNGPPTYGEFVEGNEGEDEDKDSGNTEAGWAVATVQAATAAKIQGSSHGCVDRIVGKMLQPRVCWTELLRRFVADTAAEDYDWLKPDRRYLSQGFYLPDLHSESMGELVFAIDTSGSIDQHMLDQFLAEASEALQSVRPSRLVILQCDTAIRAVDEFTPGDNVQLKLKGGGGTRFEPIFEELKKRELNPVCLVILTDMHGSFPKHAPDYPVLWVSYGGDTAPFGELIKVTL